MIRRSRRSREIMETMWQQIEAVEPSNELDASQHWDCRQMPVESESFLAGLQEQFGRDGLLEAGIATEEEDDILRFSARLSPGVSIVALHAAPGDLAFDFLLPDGLLLGEESLVYAAVHDRRIQNLLQANGDMLLAVPTLADAQFCHRIGLAAVPIVPSRQLTRSDLRQIEELTRHSDPLLLTTTAFPNATPGTSGSEELPVGEISDETPAHLRNSAVRRDYGAAEDCSVDEIDFADEMPGIDLIVCAWSFTRSEREFAGFVSGLIMEFKDARRHLQIDLSNVALWLPSQDGAERLRYCRRLNDHQSLRDAVLANINQSCFSLAPMSSFRQSEPWNVPDTFVEARRVLWRAQQDSGLSETERNDLIDEFQRLLERDIIEPLVRAAAAHRDPILGALHLQFASAVSMLQSQSPDLQRQLSRVGCGAGSKERLALDWSIRTQMKLTDGMMKIARELRR